MYEVVYDKREGVIATETFAADSVDCVGAPGWAIFWNSAVSTTVPVQVWNKDAIISIKRVS